MELNYNLANDGDDLAERLWLGIRRLSEHGQQYPAMPQGCLVSPWMASSPREEGPFSSYLDSRVRDVCFPRTGSGCRERHHGGGFVRKI